MINKIIGILRPFDLIQKFYVSIDGNTVNYKEISIDKIEETILNFLFENPTIQVIMLSGPPSFCKGVQEKIDNYLQENGIINFPIECITRV